MSLNGMQSYRNNAYMLYLYIFLMSYILAAAYAGTVKHHSVCKSYIVIDTGVKQSERTIFLHIISMGSKL